MKLLGRVVGLAGVGILMLTATAAAADPAADSRLIFARTNTARAIEEAFVRRMPTCSCWPARPNRCWVVT